MDEKRAFVTLKLVLGCCPSLPSDQDMRVCLFFELVLYFKNKRSRPACHPDRCSIAAIFLYP